ncbi:hypothetical protein ACEWY4_009765 [Coilia grayii]|uniref:Ion transport domain-containing protein n=1 Tax=Coilia grayii TaxID=363190 RepID=A0ABD1K7F3_9TELE
MDSNSQDVILETDDRTAEEIANDEKRMKDKKKRNFLFCSLGSHKSNRDKGPMDSTYLEDLGEPEIKIRLNLRNILGTEAGPDQESFRQKLFDAVSQRDVTQLDGVQEYLQRNHKQLSDSVYTLSGKTALIKALLNLRNGENDAVKYLLDIAERMDDLEQFVNTACIDNYYFGQTALHVAIERRSKYFVELLVEKGADVHAKACGNFFQWHDGPCFYFGEILPLSLAACTNQTEIVDFLLENPYQKADVRKTDSKGNNVLHALVLVADNSAKNTDFITKMYDHILTKAAYLHPKLKLEEAENNQGHTPFELVAKTGKIELLKHIMHREFHDQRSICLSRKFIEWAYGPVCASLYDLGSLDTFDKNSVLETLVYGSEIPNRLNMLQVEPLNRLLDEKWNRFAHRIFLFNFLVYLLYLCIFTSVAYFGNRKMVSSAVVVLSMLFESFPFNGHFECCIFLPSPVTQKRCMPSDSTSHFGGQYICSSEGYSMHPVFTYYPKRHHAILDIRRKRPNLQSLLIDGYFELIFFLQALLCIVSFVLYWCGRDEHLCFLVLSLALSWINLLYFSRGSRHMGIYSVMIQKILLGDILRFLLVYVVFLLGFSAAVATLIQDPQEAEYTTTTSSNQTSSNQTSSNQTSLHQSSVSDDGEKATHNSLRSIMLELFKVTIGTGDLEEFSEQHRYKEVFYVLLICYIVLTYILLLNMLIAIMGKTVEKISDESTNIWKLQRAITILDMERNLPICLRKRLRSGVEKILPGSSGDDKRWCLRVEEMKWNQVGDEDSSKMDAICEDPGSQQCTLKSTLASEKGEERHTHQAQPLQIAINNNNM